MIYSPGETWRRNRKTASCSYICCNTENTTNGVSRNIHRRGGGKPEGSKIEAEDREQGVGFLGRGSKPFSLARGSGERCEARTERQQAHDVSILNNAVLCSFASSVMTCTVI